MQAILLTHGKFLWTDTRHPRQNFMDPCHPRTHATRATHAISTLVFTYIDDYIKNMHLLYFYNSFEICCNIYNIAMVVISCNPVKE